MKQEKREEARRLRRENGLAITDICKQLGVAKSSVSMWVRDIILTDEQQAALNKQHYAYWAQTRGAHTNAIKGRERRVIYQEEGRQKAREGDPLHLAGCMLYWGEGTKARNSLQMSNSDAGMLVFYMRFLRESLKVNSDQIVLRIFCYLGNGSSTEDIESYWLQKLQLPQSCLRKTKVNVQTISSQQKGRKLVYGTCEISVHETRLIQHVLGAIQEYAGIEKTEWLM
jgi:transposase-like protein